MVMPNSWVAMNSSNAERYGGGFVRSQAASPEVSGDMTALPSNTAPIGSGLAGLDTSSGLVMIGAIAAVSFGLMAFATTVRVGHAEAHVGVGKS